MPEWKMAAKQSEIWFNCIKSLLPACNILQNSTCFQVWIHSWLKIVLLGTFTHCFTFVHLQCCNLKRFFSRFSLLVIRDSLCSSLHSSIPFYWLWGPLDSVLVPEGQVEIQRGSLLVCNKSRGSSLNSNAQLNSYQLHASADCDFRAPSGEDKKVYPFGN